MKLEMEPLDLSKTLARSLRVVSGRADDKTLVLDAGYREHHFGGGRSPRDQADHRITGSNAVKFTPDGGRGLSCSRLLQRSVVLMIVIPDRHRAAFAGPGG